MLKLINKITTKLNLPQIELFCTYDSSVFPFIEIFPSPDKIFTLATEDFLIKLVNSIKIQINK